jgi:hypothetical protein
MTFRIMTLRTTMVRIQAHKITILKVKAPWTAVKNAILSIYHRHHNDFQNYYYTVL